jgi:hypothetical protein
MKFHVVMRKSISPPQYVERPKEAPARKMAHLQEAYDYLRTRIKEQDTSIYRLASILADALTRKESAWGADKPLLYKAILAGTSGCGKTETVLRVKEFLGMAAGYEYEHQFIEIEGVTMSEEVPSGLSAALVGYSLADRLNGALSNYKNDEWWKLETMNHQTQEYKQAYAEYTQKQCEIRPEEVAVPPYLLLFIDEIDKAPLEFILLLTTLMDTGNYTSPSQVSFRLPKQTALIILCTSNYAAERLCQMEPRNDEVAESLVKKAMGDNRLRAHTIERMGKILPYYPLRTEALRLILMEKLEDYVNKSVIANRFGSNAISYDQDVKNMLVDHVLLKVNSEYGIRGSIGQLIFKLNIFFGSALGVLDQMVSGGQPLNAPIRVTAHNIDTRLFGASFDQEFDRFVKDFKKKDETRSLIQSLRDNPDNRQTLSLCNPREEGRVNAVAMAYGNAPLCSLVMNITYNNYQIVNQYDSKESAREVQRLNERVNVLKDALKEVIHTVDSSNKEASFNITMKRVADSKRDLIESSEDSEHEYQSKPPPDRKSIIRAARIKAEVAAASIIARRRRKRKFAEMALSLITEDSSKRRCPSLFASASDSSGSGSSYCDEGDDEAEEEEEEDSFYNEDKNYYDDPDDPSTSLNTRSDYEEEDDDDDDIEDSRSIDIGSDSSRDYERVSSSLSSSRKIECSTCKNFRDEKMFMRKRRDKQNNVRMIFVPSCGTCRKYGK